MINIRRLEGLVFAFPLHGLRSSKSLRRRNPDGVSSSATRKGYIRTERRDFSSSSVYEIRDEVLNCLALGKRIHPSERIVAPCCRQAEST